MMSLRKKVLLGLLTCVLFFSAAGMLLELVAWAAGYPATPMKYQKSLWLPDAELGWTCRPDATFHYLAPGGWQSGSTDGHGYRPVLTSANDPEAAVVVCLGDSTTFSAECRDGETWPESAARALADRGVKAACLNRGVGGYSGVQALLTLRRTLRDLPRPPCAVVYHFAYNDPDENWDSPQEMPRPCLFQPGAAGEGEIQLRPGRAWDFPSDSLGGWLKSNLRCYSMYRSWTRSTSAGAFAEAAQDIKARMQDPCERMTRPTSQREGVRFVIERMKKECDAVGTGFFVSFANVPFWDDNAQARREAETILDLTAQQVRLQAEAYGQACDVLGRLTAGCGAEFIDTRNVLAGMRCEQWAAAHNDAHLSPAANERMGRQIAHAIRKRISVRAGSSEPARQLPLETGSKR